MYIASGTTLQKFANQKLKINELLHWSIKEEKANDLIAHVMFDPETDTY